MIFSCVFAIQLSQDALHSDIIRTLNESGPANTGLTFIWFVFTVWTGAHT